MLKNSFRFAISLGAFALGACGDSDNTPPEQSVFCAGNGIVISDAWIRAPRPGQRTSAAYLSICNGGGVDDTLVSVSFDHAAAAELHMTEIGDDGRATMRPETGGVLLAAGTNTTFHPEGRHIMLIAPDSDLASLEEAPITLTFETEQAITILFEVRKSDGDTPGDHNHH